MPKRKRSEKNEFEYFKKKLKKLEKQMRKRTRIISSSSSSRDSSPMRSPHNPKDGDNQSENEQVTQTHFFCDNNNSPTAAPTTHDSTIEEATAPVEVGAPVLAEIHTPALDETPMLEDIPAIDDTGDNMLLEILGEDPSLSIDYGPEIQKDLASRLEYITTTELDPKLRKELLSKYLVPANATRIAAPTLNAEIKAALPENLLKRDKIIEAKQKQLAAAISCLSSIMTDQIITKQINQDILKKLMDTSRLLCDIQHSDSKTRRNFNMFSLKKDMKDHLLNTKIDKFLFGENLSETLKTAKAVNRSVTDLKVQQKAPVKIPQQLSKTQPSKNLNWKPPAPARRPTQGPKSNREPASLRAPPANSFRWSSPPRKITRRR